MKRRTTPMSFAAIMGSDIGDPRDACNARGSEHQERSLMLNLNPRIPATACSTPARAVETTLTQAERDHEVAARINAAIRLIEGYEDIQIGIEALDGAVGVLRRALEYFVAEGA